MTLLVLCCFVIIIVLEFFFAQFSTQNHCGISNIAFVFRCDDWTAGSKMGRTCQRINVDCVAQTICENDGISSEMWSIYRYDFETAAPHCNEAKLTMNEITWCNSIGFIFCISFDTCHTHTQAHSHTHNIQIGRSLHNTNISISLRYDH